MDELKLLIEMVANLPSLAVWVLVGYLVYKVVVVGSVYGVIRLLIVKTHDWLTRPKVVQLGAACINEATKTALELQVHRLIRSNLNYIHMDDVDRLRRALDLIEAEKKG